MAAPDTGGATKENATSLRSAATVVQKSSLKRGCLASSASARQEQATARGVLPERSTSAVKAELEVWKAVMARNSPTPKFVLESLDKFYQKIFQNYLHIATNFSYHTCFGKDFIKRWNSRELAINGKVDNFITCNVVKKDARIWSDGNVFCDRNKTEPRAYYKVKPATRPAIRQDLNGPPTCAVSRRQRPATAAAAICINLLNPSCDHFALSLRGSIFGL
ncbi:hypothetical protein EVAR_61273_1 [Eumeta japonica]|uniref:Uncharacterized protein n=1 Tax=Eumeta variegata TaxID=151549 RepID=A0A4C1Z7K5_EUMVA|nr:hypothetical protein EVAR_61273_1 [Eumeta japonica]